MVRFLFFLLFLFLCLSQPVSGDAGDCLWGGKNEKTTYSSTFVPGMGGITLAQYQQPAMNLGAPAPAQSIQSIPIQPATPVPSTPYQPTYQTQPVNIPQTNIPTITIPAGPVGSVGQPATTSVGLSAMNTQIQSGTPLSNVAAPIQIVYILPSSAPSESEIYVDGIQTVPATETKVVPANTPGAIPAILKTVMVRKPKFTYRWTYSPIVNKTETLVNVVDPRTGKVVRTFSHEDEDRSMLPWLHRREEVSYETVEAQIAVPISTASSASSAVNTVILGGLP